MTTRDTPFAPGTPCWVDLASSDIDASKRFYSALFGWHAEESGPEFGNYITFDADGRPVAGLAGNQPGAGADHWTTYISTEDIAGTISDAEDAGAKVALPAMAVGDLGMMALLFDPAGALVGLWQPGEFIGFTRYNEPGSVTWDEHHSKDFPASTAFYTTVFSWAIEKTSDTDDFRYYQGQIDGETVVGLMDSQAFLPADVPSHWAVYFSVANVDDALANATALGAAVRRDAEDTPFGRIADLVDPTGAAFKLHGPNLDASAE